jgi:hypothetical protein
MRTLLLALGWTVAVAAPGCGGGGGGDGEGPDLGGELGGGGGGEVPRPTGPVNARGQDEVEARVGPAGGQLELSNGARLEIPAGALNESTQIAIRIGPPTQAVGRREGEQQIGPVILIEPAVVAAPGHRITVSIPLNSPPSGYEPSDLAVATEEPDDSRAMEMGGNTTRWTMGPASHQGGRLRAEVEQLFGLRLQFVASR